MLLTGLLTASREASSLNNKHKLAVLDQLTTSEPADCYRGQAQARKRADPTQPQSPFFPPHPKQTTPRLLENGVHNSSMILTAPDRNHKVHVLRLIDEYLVHANPTACYSSTFTPYIAPRRTIHLYPFPQRRIHNPKHRTPRLSTAQKQHDKRDTDTASNGRRKQHYFPSCRVIGSFSTRRHKHITSPYGPETIPAVSGGSSSGADLCFRGECVGARDYAVVSARGG